MIPMPEVDGVEHRHLEVNGRGIHVAEAGSGPPVVLLHTSFQHWYAWRRLIPLLAPEHRLICPDMRGCGWSDAPPNGYEKEELAAELVALLDALEIERAGLVGHGLGGLVGFLAALAAPERFRGYVAIGVIHPWPRLDARLAAGLWRSWYQPLVAAPGGARLARSRAFLNWMFRRTSPHREAWPDSEIDAHHAVLQDPARSRAVSLMYRALITRELGPMFAGRYRDRRLAVPTTLLFGTRDAFLSTAGLRGYEPYADAMTVELLEGEGHFVHSERPELVAGPIRSLFAAEQVPT